MRLAVILTIMTSHSLSFAQGDPSPSRGRSECESRPGLCAWPGSASGRSRTIESRDEVRTSAAAPKRTGKPEEPNKASKLSPYEGGSGGGNLPSYLTDNERRAATTDGFIIVAEKQTGALLHGLRAGDRLQAVLDQSIKASPTVPTPIWARVVSGRFRNTTMLGTAVFDRELKRILLTFDRLRLPGNDTGYSMKATGLAPSGQVGLEGDHHTQEGTYFIGEVLTATAAGYADATTQRTQTLAGGFQIGPSVGSAAKQGAVSALSKTADHFAEQARTAPEYTEIEAGREIQILLQSDPMEASGS